MSMLGRSSFRLERHSIFNAGHGILCRRGLVFITQSGFYFISPLYPTMTISGRVVGNDGIPINRAIVSTRGQCVFTGSDGRFTLANIPVIKTVDDSVILDTAITRSGNEFSSVCIIARLPTLSSIRKIRLPLSSSLTIALPFIR